MPIDLALLGCGHPDVPDVLGVLAAEPDLRLAAVWDADPSAVPAAIGGAAVARAETAIRRAHAVVVCAPVDQRPALCSQAARAGRPLLVVPPVGRTVAEARAVEREVSRSRTPAVALLPLRELPAVARLSGVLRERILGRLGGVEAALSHGGAGTLDGPRAWLRDPARAGLGGFGERAQHVVDLLGLLSPGEPPRLAAVSLDHGERGDVGGVALGAWRGVPAVVRGSWVTRPGGLEVTVRGAAATAVLREGTLELQRGSGEPERWIGPPPDAGEAVRAFAAALRARRFPRGGLAAAVRAHEALEAAVRI